MYIDCDYDFVAWDIMKRWIESYVKNNEVEEFPRDGNNYIEILLNYDELEDNFFDKANNYRKLAQLAVDIRDLANKSKEEQEIVNLKICELRLKKACDPLNFMIGDKIVIIPRVKREGHKINELERNAIEFLKDNFENIEKDQKKCVKKLILKVIKLDHKFKTKAKDREIAKVKGLNIG